MAGESPFGPSTGTTTFSVHNTGFAEIQLERVSVRTPGAAFPIEDVRAGWPFESLRLPFTIEPRSEAFVQLRHGRLACGVGVMPATASVRCRVNGAARTMSLPLSISANRVCG